MQNEPRREIRRKSPRRRLRKAAQSFKGPEMTVGDSKLQQNRPAADLLAPDLAGAEFITD